LDDKQLSLEMLIEAHRNNTKSFYDSMENGYRELLTYLSNASYSFPYRLDDAVQGRQFTGKTVVLEQGDIYGNNTKMRRLRL
jgi:hypothetical protein